MDWGLYAFFLVTTVMLILVPGPSALTVAAQGASQGSCRAFWGVLGVASADVFYFCLSATGIASLIIASSLMFSLIKWFGVVYLLYLGMSAFFSKGGAIRIDVNPSQCSRRKGFSQGLLVQLANPKALMYFSALLPQFIDPAEPVLSQLLIMGLSCLLADLMVYSLFGRLGETLAKQKLNPGMVKLINRAAGVALISTGIRMLALD